MTKFDDIWEIAIDDHGLITSEIARGLGVSNHEMVEFARRGKLERVGHGVYQLVKRMPEENDPYALAVKLVGSNAYLYGESVIALLKLAPTDPSRMYVATPERVRKALPNGIRVVRVRDGKADTLYDGIPAQRAANAIRSALGTVESTRLMEAADEGHRRGYITKQESDYLVRILSHA